MSRPKKATNPYRTGDTKLWTENVFDTAGRSWKVITPDSAFVETIYGLATSGTTIGTVVTVTDQALKQRRSITNSLGQLSRVDEPNDSYQLGTIASPNQPTNYSYNTLNNLIQVQQIGTTTQLCGGTVSYCVQTRSFAYDSLERLKQATNPESGTINYSYDANGNLLNKSDARSITTSYVYDNLNRVTQRNYSDGTTPTVNYYYDNLTNAKGKLIKVSSAISTTEYTSFDTMGRLTGHKQTTDGNDYTTSYVYNLSGAMLEETYPSGRVVKNTLDADGDLMQVQSRKANDTFRNYANSFNYTAAGAVSSMRLGNGRWENMQFNSRLQPTQIGLGTSATNQSLLKLDYDYGQADNNGNIKSQTITVPTVGSNQGFTAVQTYAYDSLNRIKQATENIDGNQTPSWKQTFTFDRYGNRRFDTANTTTLDPNCPFAVCNPEINTANNRLIGTTYDNAGSTTTDASGKTFTYDGENKQTKVQNGSTIIGEYYYDGDGKRIKKYVPSTGEITIFIYDASGKMVAEYSTIVAPQSEAKISYLTNDHLGSPRIITNALGQVTSRRDFMPFGEDIYSTQRTANLNYTADNVRQKFTSYERDNETEEDFAEARYYNYKLGRFNSVDPLMASANINSPQTFNRYSYVMNNPINLTDPTGMKAGCPEGQKCEADDQGNEYYLDAAGKVVYTGIVGTVVTVGVKEAVKEVIIEPSFWEMVWYKTKKGASTVGRITGKGLLTVARGAGAVVTILTNPTSTGCGASPGMVSNGDGGCVYDATKDITKMSDEIEKDANPDDPADSDTPSGTKKKQEKDTRPARERIPGSLTKARNFPTDFLDYNEAELEKMANGPKGTDKEKAKKVLKVIRQQKRLQEKTNRH